MVGNTGGELKLAIWQSSVGLPNFKSSKLLHTKYFTCTDMQLQSPIVENALTALVGPFPAAYLPICAC